jgi:hypothetical protein
MHGVNHSIFETKITQTNPEQKLVTSRPRLPDMKRLVEVARAFAAMDWFAPEEKAGFLFRGYGQRF